LPAICDEASALVAEAVEVDDDDEVGSGVVPETTGLAVAAVTVMSFSSNPDVDAAA
jgi:hypothetical protein